MVAAARTVHGEAMGNGNSLHLLDTPIMRIVFHGLQEFFYFAHTLHNTKYSIIVNCGYKQKST